MPVFTPPIQYDRGPFAPDSTEIQKALFKWMPTSPRFVQVFLLSDGSVVQDTPGGFAPDGSEVSNTNTALPYPWNPNDPAGPYATSVYPDYTVNPPVIVTDEEELPVWIVTLFNGATEVSEYVASQLTEAGYAACLS